uniref:NADH-ubiquinone oxidoreductase chain 6 n=1 Tax=Gastroclonium compressum TaxID=1852973 RepID=A0A173FZQ2_GASCM|nr:NADH dehydrogenase subunit 6 [Coeloseira compressa]
MFIDLFLFSAFFLFIIFSSIMVISLKNAVHSVLFLILVFCNMAALLLTFGVEFLSFMILIVYVGAIAVLFLFVVMMLNIKFSSLSWNLFSLFPLGFLIFLIIGSHVFYTITDFNIFNLIQNKLTWISWFEESFLLTNVEIIGQTLYTKFSLLFLLSSLILLVAMIGAIVLTMHQRKDVKKQEILFQLTRNFKGVTKFITLRD